MGQPPIDFGGSNAYHVTFVNLTLSQLLRLAVTLKFVPSIGFQMVGRLNYASVSLFRFYIRYLPRKFIFFKIDLRYSKEK